MASNRFIGYAPAIAQVDDWTFGGTWEATDEITITIGNKSVTFDADSTSIATVIANVVSDWTNLDASVYPEFAEITPSAFSGTVLRLTANTAGKPFDALLETFEDGGGAADAQTLTGPTATIPSSGPFHWDTAANWSLGTVPAATNDVYVDGVHTILYGLDQSALSALNSLTIELQQGGVLGLNDLNTDATPYQEYRQKELKIKATTVTVRSQSSRIRIDNYDAATTVNCYSTGTGEDTGFEAFCWRGTNASNVFNALGGQIGVAIRDGETATIATLRTTQVNGFLNLRCGPTVTLTTVSVGDGTVIIPPGATTVTQGAGTLYITGAANVTTLTVEGGVCHPDFQGTITTLTLGGVFDCSTDARPITVTDSVIRRGADLQDRDKRLTFTNASTRQCRVTEFRWDHGATGTIKTT